MLTELTDKNFDPDSLFLLERLKEGDRKIFARLFDYYYSGLVIFADRYLRDQESAEDVVQSVFVKMWENRETLKMASVRSHLVSSVRNSCIDVIRKSATREKYIQRQIHQSTPVEEDFRAESELKEMIETAIGKLPPKCREIFELSRFEGLSSKEIAQKLQLSQRTVETHITHALKILRKELKDYLFHFFFIF